MELFKKYINYIYAMNLDYNISHKETIIFRFSEIPESIGCGIVGIIYNKGKENQNAFIHCSYAFILQKMQGNFIRFRPKNFREHKMFFNLFDAGLVNHFNGGYELSGIAQRAGYEIVWKIERKKVYKLSFWNIIN